MKGHVSIHHYFLKVKNFSPPCHYREKERTKITIKTLKWENNTSTKHAYSSNNKQMIDTIKCSKYSPKYNTQKKLKSKEKRIIDMHQSSVEHWETSTGKNHNQHMLKIAK